MRSNQKLWLCTLLPLVTACQPPQASHSTAASSASPSYLRADLADQVRSESGVIRCGEPVTVPGAITAVSETEIQSKDPEVEAGALKASAAAHERFEAIFEAHDDRVVTYVASNPDEIKEALRQRDECFSNLLAKISAKAEPESPLDAENFAAYAKGQLRLGLEKQTTAKGPSFTGAAGAIATVAGTYAAYKPKAHGLARALKARNTALDRMFDFEDMATNPFIEKRTGQFRPTPNVAALEKIVAHSNNYLRKHTTRIAAVGVGLAALSFAAYKIHKAISASDYEKLLKANDRLAELVSMEDEEFREHVTLFPEDGQLVIDAQARL